MTVCLHVGDYFLGFSWKGNVRYFIVVVDDDVDVVVVVIVVGKYMDRSNAIDPFIVQM